MNSRTVCLLILLCVVSSAQITEREKQSGRYYTPGKLLLLMSDAGTEKSAMYYLEGAYDLTQDSGKSCAQRGVTTAELLEKVFSDYVNAHKLTGGNRTAAGVAAQAFAEYWPCKKQ